MDAVRIAPLILLLVSSTGLGQERPPSDPYGFGDWIEGFPGQLDMPTRRPGVYYDRSRTQAIERVVANLQGNTRREVWLMAREFFARAPEDAIEPLIRAMDRAALDPAMSDLVANCVEAMGRMGNEAFDEALQRALEHKNQAVRQAAYTALASSGKPETIRRCFSFFAAMDVRARKAWLRAARLRLADQAVSMFRHLMTPDWPIPIRDLVLEETLKMPNDAAAAVLRDIWPHAVGDFKTIIAGVLHAAGDPAGTAYLHSLLTGEDPGPIPQAVRSAARGDLGELREDVLRLSFHSRPEVRLAVVGVLADLPGEDVDGALESLADPNEVWDIKSVALRALTRRGKGAVVDSLLDEMKTATGTRLDMIMTLLAASGDPRAIPLLLERYRKAPSGEGRPFLQAMAHSRCPAAFDPLAEIFLAEQKPVTDTDRPGGALTTVGYIPILLLNLPDIDDRMIELWKRIPREDVIRRAHLMNALNGMAAEREDPLAAAPLLAPLREVLFDRGEQSQLRIWALTLLTRKSLRLAEARRLARERDQESPPMQAYLNDYLNDYF
ncbi:MAG: hypothetical protein Fur0037_11220 [Planctomycetota bacterium]